MNNKFPNANYPPYGYNDNNFNRQSFPSNNYPDYSSDGNPMAHFKPVTTNSNHQYNQSKFNDAYKQNTQIIEPPNYKNNNNLLHNNVAEQIMDENIVEYKIIIDSSDRDIRTYLNPFSFTVKFGANAGGIVKSKKNTNNEYIEGPPQPYINKEFKNVKFIKLDTIVLPKCTINEHNYCTLDDRYISLCIDEIDNNTILTTGDNNSRYDESTNKTYNAPKPFAIIFPDKLVSKTHYTGTPYYGNKSYKSSNLANIRSMTIKFTDSYGKPLSINNLYSFDKLEMEKDNGNEIFLSDDRHPLNKKYQLSFSLIIGVVECQIATNTKFFN